MFFFPSICSVEIGLSVPIVQPKPRVSPGAILSAQRLSSGDENLLIILRLCTIYVFLYTPFIFTFIL